jgi:hypothetical protein
VQEGGERQSDKREDESKRHGLAGCGSGLR